jgi:hypothetical protein
MEGFVKANEHLARVSKCHQRILTELTGHQPTAELSENAEKAQAEVRELERLFGLSSDPPSES